MQTITLDEIKALLPSLDLLPAMEEGFVAYSSGRAVVPPVGELLLDKGEAHIKYGYLRDEPHYVIKIASGFYDNPKLGLPSSNGLMLLFKQETGELICILLDQGYLTDVRTAVAGAVCARHLAPRRVNRIGIVGTGAQARLQLSFLKTVISRRDVLVWGRSESSLRQFRHKMASKGYKVETTRKPADILRTCNLIITATPSKEPLLLAEDLRGGTHMTAVGSDTPFKQELDSMILKRADVVVADSISQCLERGEIHKALENRHIQKEKLIELGNVIAGKVPGRTGDQQITVADLTGVAVQDIKIATAVFKALR